MMQLLAVSVVLGVLVLLSSACVPLKDNIRYPVERVEDEDNEETPRELEYVLTTPNCLTAKANLRHYASTAHMAGTKEDYNMAIFTQNKMKEYGLKDSKIHEMKSYLSYPVSRSLKLLDNTGKVSFTAPLSEGELDSDPSSHTPWRNMSFLGYSPSGDVLAPVVYANYGRPEDFKVLLKAGIDIRDKIVLTRYGKCFRGLKVMNAQRLGAAGVIIYSDPADDGYNIGKVYPEGPWRPETSVQRGSVIFNSLCGGDPARTNSNSTPEEICGYSRDEMIPKIPAIPISYKDARPILKSLRGPEAPSHFIGGLKLEYHLGPSTESQCHLVVNNTFTTTPIWNVITTIKGTLPPELDQPVVVSNHRDGWVYGAADPNSGSASVLEMAKSLGKMIQNGWKPKRTIIIGSWSGEEYGLLGSTGWAEEFAESVLKRASVLINTDVGVGGNDLRVQASPSLADAFRRATTKVNDPATGKPLNHRWDHKIDVLGSGSDYTVFLDHLGIPSLDTSFAHSPENSYGVYHSIYDSYTWIETQVDPEYKYHVALAQLLGVLVLDFADKEILPISLSSFARALFHYVDLVKVKAAQAMIDFAELHAAVSEFSRQANAYNPEKHSAAQVNDLLGTIERSFLDEKGLPRRKWFKHILQAPGLYLGYNPQVFPGIVEALTEKDFSLAQDQVGRVAAIIQNAAQKIKQASSTFSQLDNVSGFALQD